MRENRKYRKRRIRKVLSKLGFLLLMIGCSGMDSPNVIVPAIMVLSGLAIMGITAYKEFSLKGVRR